MNYRQMTSGHQMLRAWMRTGLELLQHPKKFRYGLDDVEYLSDVETLNFLLETDSGIVRLGDGELNYLAGYPTIYESHNVRIEQKLRDILLSYSGNTYRSEYIVCLPLMVTLGREYESRGMTKENWRGIPSYIVRPFLQKNTVYGSPFCFRLENVLTTGEKDEYLAKIYELFADQYIVYVGDENHLAEHLEVSDFIQIPSRDAFRRYDGTKSRILEVVDTVDDPLVVISGGVTASVWAAELNSRGVRTYDVGSLYRYL